MRRITLVVENQKTPPRDHTRTLDEAVHDRRLTTDKVIMDQLKNAMTPKVRRPVPPGEYLG